MDLDYQFEGGHQCQKGDLDISQNQQREDCMIPDLCTQNLDVTGIKTEIIAMFKHIKYF